MLCLTTALLSLAPPPVALQGPTQHKTLTQLVDVHAFSVPGALTSTPEGEVVLVAEGGALAILDNSPTNADWSDAARLARIGSEGIVPLELLLDPTAYDTQADPRFDYAYVAAGRFGLWAVDLTGTGEYTARRIDDSADQYPAGQDSRRWCDDLAIITIGSTEYLVALFAAKDDSRLRAYPLDTVRATFLHSSETGAELAPSFDIHLTRHPLGSQDHESFAYGMAVDTWSSGSTTHVDVYVAMGFHGLARVRIQYDYIPPAVPVNWGPIFGDGSFAAEHAPQNPGIYDNLVYKGRTNWPVERSDPPVFVDVAVQSDGASERKLYAAIDHLGWARFDLGGLTLPADWDDELLPDHHEGVIGGIGKGAQVWEHKLNLVENDKTYVHEIDFLDHPTEGPLLAVTCGSRPIVIEPGTATEGRVQDYSTHVWSGVRSRGIYYGDGLYTLLYDVSASAQLTSFEINALTTLSGGGSKIRLLDKVVATDKVHLIGGNSEASPAIFDAEALPLTTAHATFLVEVDLDPDPPTWTILEQREAEHRPGRSTLFASRSVQDPRVLMTAGNDSGLQVNGILVTDCSGGIVSHYVPDEFGHDGRATHGISFGPLAQWSDGGFNYSMGVDTPESGPRAFVLKKFSIPADPCNDSPELLKTVYFESPVERWNDLSRLYWTGGVANALYSIENLAGWPVLFMAQDGTPDGIWVFNSEVLQAELEKVTIPDGSYIEKENLESAYVQVLDTHPEFSEVPTFDEDPRTETFLKKTQFFPERVHGNLSILAPDLFKVEGQGSDPDRWLLAAPAFYATFDPELEFLDDTEEGYDQWAPPTELGLSYTMGLVRIFDVTDPDVESILDLGSIVIPRVETTALRAKVQEIGGAYYLFVANYAGSILAYDLTSLLAIPTGELPVAPAVNVDVYDTPVAEWFAPASMTDDQPNNILSLEVDRVQWCEEGVPQDETYLYVPVWRVGLMLLRFVHDAPGGPVFEEVELVQTPIGPVDVHIRDVLGERTLLLSEPLAGLRIYEYAFEGACGGE